MRWTELFNPEKIIAFAFKLFLVLMALISFIHLFEAFLARASLFDVAALLGFLAVLSVGAFLLRERRRGRNAEPKSTRGAERTPLFPKRREDR